MGQTWYKTSQWGRLITPVTVISQTDKQVVTFENGRQSRNAKITTYTGYFKTIDEAKKHVHDYFEKKVLDYQRYLLNATNDYDRIVKELKEY